MSAASESSVMSSPNDAVTEVECAPPAFAFSNLRSLFRPCTPAFVFLSIAVALCGFGYKLSRYNPHPDIAARAVCVKLWDKHQDLSQVTGGIHPSAPSEVHLPLHEILYLFDRCPALEPAFSDQDEGARVPGLFRSLIPLRSPPSDILAA